MKTYWLVLEEKFKDEGFNVAVAHDGQEVEPEAKRFMPNVILLDLILPKKFGLDVLEDLKKDSELKSIPVIVVSNMEGDGTKKKALTLGAEDYFVKTHHSITEIVERVGSLFKNSQKNKLLQGI